MFELMLLNSTNRAVFAGFVQLPNRQEKIKYLAALLLNKRRTQVAASAESMAECIELVTELTTGYELNLGGVIITLNRPECTKYVLDQLAFTCLLETQQAELCLADRILTGDIA